MISLAHILLPPREAEEACHRGKVAVLCMHYIPVSVSVALFSLLCPSVLFVVALDLEIIKKTQNTGYHNASTLGSGLMFFFLLQVERRTQGFTMLQQADPK